MKRVTNESMKYVILAPLPIAIPLVWGTAFYINLLQSIRLYVFLLTLILAETL
jgi:hypothetical protein